MPTPRDGESKDEFVSRCIGEVAGEKGPDGKKRPQKQAIAMCYQMWRDKDKKEVDVEDKSWSDVPVAAIAPMGVYTLAEWATAQEQAERNRELEGMSEAFLALARNIIYEPEIADKGSALRALADEYASLTTAESAKEPEPEEDTSAKPIDETDFCIDVSVVADSIGGFKEIEERPGLIERIVGMVVGAVKSLFRPRDSESGFAVYKDQTTGAWRWLAIFSNKFRDRDNPPEIISDSAHKDFVAAVDKGEWPHPELWLWHIPGTRWGIADYVAYDDRGFVVASGTVDKDKTEIAEKMATDTNVLVSHGMPTAEVSRDNGDGTIITRYRSMEISPLPAWAAANELTGFAMEGGQDMPLPKEKRDWLKDRIGEAAVGELEAAIEQKARTAEERGLEFKEAEPEPDTAKAPAEETKEAVSESATEVTDEVAADGAPAPLTQDQILSAFNQAVAPLIQRIEALESKATAEPEPPAEEKQVTTKVPAASIAELVRTSVIGAIEAQVRKGDPLLKRAPKETQPSGKTTGIPFVDAMLSGQDWRDTLRPAEKEV